MTLTAVVVSHGNESGLHHLLGNLRYQTRPPDEILVYACCIPLARFREQFPEAVFTETTHQGDWGHKDRATGLEAANSRYVGFFNGDDSYENDFVEKMLVHAEAHEADVVYCGWNTYPECDFRLGSSTSGNFIVYTDLAKFVGYPATKVYENDGHFINALAKEADVIVYVPEVLYHHNVQSRD